MAGVTFNLTLQSLFLFILAIPLLHLYFLYKNYVSMYAKYSNVKSIVFYFWQTPHFSEVFQEKVENNVIVFRFMERILALEYRYNLDTVLCIEYNSTVL